MQLSELQKAWDQLGKDDPLWAVLTDPAKKGGKWDLGEFFITGDQQVATLLAKIASLGFPLQRGTALDFGCGVGRLTQSLARHFAHTDGVDISPSMLERANTYNRFPNKCQYHLNSHDHLCLFPNNHFDFILSDITLQHIHPRHSKAYIAEFVRLLKPAGLLVFQTLRPTFWRRLCPDTVTLLYRKVKHGRKLFINMFGLSEHVVRRVLLAAGGKVLHVERGPTESRRWISLCYFVTKPAPLAVEPQVARVPRRPDGPTGSSLRLALTLVL